ncbi:transcription repressor NadR [Anaerovorax odorimutans]|uniref:Transcription repressor NadR n=1 Tax=Anaerovorax odorimutans TaxID=109327 RepID=A0ABT1RTH7_9FIRM|nr:transcription repressor NadR [Anaerovorax odorimutans]MCQ4638504.1 transcription repressor NadR [Anaerovorax odorimutans]
MDAKKRRSQILSMLKKSDTPVSASSLAENLSVSRQIIVGDVAILRASGACITATPRGYVYEEESSGFPYEGLLACRHTPAQLQEELYTIVDFGGFVIDVTIEHPLYGQLSGPLNIGSRYDVDLFIEKVEAAENAKPLSVLTGGIHLHRIGCKDKSVFSLIRDQLDERGIIFSSVE